MTDGLSGNVGTFAYRSNVTTADVEGYTDTTYTAGNGLSISPDNVIELTASGAGKVTFIDWSIATLD